MSSLLALVVDVIQAAAPLTPGLELEDPITILSRAFSHVLSAAQITNLNAALQKSGSGDTAALARAADFVAPVANRADAIERVVSTAAGLAELLMLRTLLS